MALTGVLLSVPLVASADGPRATAAEEAGDPRVELELLAARSSVAPGESFRVGVRFVLDPHWHVYFRNPGEAAMATEVVLDGEGATFGALRWPVPARLLDPSGTITTFGYEEEVLFAAPATALGDADTVRVVADADFLVCRVDCIPGRARLELAIPVGESRPSDAVAAFDANEVALPRLDPAPLRVRFSPPAAPLTPGARATATFEIVACEEREPGCPTLAPPPDEAAAFFADRVPALRVDVESVRPHPTAHSGLQIQLALAAGPDDPGEDQTLSGILTLRRDGAPLALEVSGPLPRASTDAPRVAAETDEAPPQEPLSLLWVLLLGLLGGVILNAMPCVLPVLAIKVVALGEIAHRGARSRALHVLAYAMGIVASVLALAGLVLALRAGGTAVGWGFQLQEPLFATALAAALVVFALGLFGVYTLRVDAAALRERTDDARGLGRAFGEGVLAVVLATPCSAPFLGTALGFAFAGSAAQILLVFTAIGLGLALPFALVALVPGARRLIPRPGAWMEILERVLGFLLLGTAVWLVWIVGQITGTEGMARALVFLLAVAFATWLLARSWSGRRWTGSVFALLAVVAAGAFAFPLPERSVEVDDRAWSPDRVQAALAEGRPVFVDFTADWCITCRANERLVLDTEEVRAALDETDTLFLVADWTQRDETIRAVLAEHGKAGVPLYLVYHPGRSEPQVLPELLTGAIVTSALHRGATGDDR